MSRRIWTVFLKELVDNLRDRRSWALSLVFVLIGPLTLWGAMHQLAQVSTRESTSVYRLPMSGANHAPRLVEFLAQQRIEITPAPADPEAAIRAREAEVVVVIPESYPREFRAGRPATVRVLFDESRRLAMGNVRRVESALHAYGSNVGALRLLARGVSPEATRALALEEANLATPESRGAVIFSMVPMFLLIALFAGGMYVAMDVMAGERERGSLEPLLLNPITPFELVLGKYLTTLLFSLATGLLSAVGFAVVLNAMPSALPGIRLGLSAPAFVALWATLLPLGLLGAALQILFASLARSFKEAQTSLQFLNLVPALPGIWTVLTQSSPPEIWPWIPVLAQEQLLQRVLGQEALPVVESTIAALGTLAAAALVLALTIVRYQRQRVLFG